MPPADILVTGGTGKTGCRVVARLRGGGIVPRVATRQVKSAEVVRFDWSDPTSFDSALNGVRAIYLVSPPTGYDTLATMRPFIDRALGQGVERFVLLSASSLAEGGPMMGAVHAYLRAHAPSWVVLRPSWFMQNFSEGQHLPTIRDEDTIYSATGEGRIPFIDAKDIAAVAAQALTEPSFPSGELVLTGPQTLSYREAAAIFTRVIGRPVVHRALTAAEMIIRFEQGGLPSPYAQTLVAMDEAIADGSEDRTTNSVQTVTSKPPGTLECFIKANIRAWQR